MNKVGSDTAAWHLEQAALYQQIAARAARRGFYHDSWVNRDKAQEHRDKAAILDKRTAA